MECLSVLVQNCGMFVRPCSEMFILFIYRPDVDLVGNTDDVLENATGLELDDVGLRRNIDEILNNEVWVTDAA